MLRERAAAASPGGGPGRAGLHRRPRLVWALAFVSYLGLIAAWALATPISASPDEPEHVHRAAAVVRGEVLVPEPPTGLRPYVSVPEAMVSPSKRDLCFAFHPDTTADCASELSGSTDPVPVRSGAARYNPAYYALVGLPSLAFPDLTGIYLMRLLSGALCAALLASALASAVAWRRSRLLVVALLVVVTPMVLFLSATVNPSPVEIAAAISLWTAGLVLAVTPVGTDLTPVLLRRCAVAGTLLVVTRQLSPLWLAIIVVVLALVAGRRRLLALAARRDTRLWALLVFVTTAASSLWIVVVGSLGTGYPGVAQLTLLEGIKGSVLRMPYRTEQMVGIFGWLDTRAPWFTYISVTSAVGSLILLGLVTSAWRGKLLIGLTLAIAVGMPLLIEGSQATRYGYIWQGRYTLPLAVGVPLAAMLVAGVRGALPDLTRPLALWLALPLAAAQAGAFAYALLRYQVGKGNGYDLLAGSWHPPGGSPAVLALFAVALAALSALVVACAKGPVTAPARRL